MNPEIKNEFVERLTSGRYEQGRSCLRSGDKFCCLGVLADIVDPNGWVSEDCEGVTYHRHHDQYNLPSSKVRVAAGLNDSDVRQLFHMNDGAFAYEGRPQSFAQIAEHVKNNL